MAPRALAVLVIIANAVFGDSIPAAGIPQVFNMQVCTQYGQVCSANCKGLGICFESASGFNWQETMACGDGLFCDNQALGCVAKEKSTCVPNVEQIICGTQGTFPNLYDCRNSMKCASVNEPAVADPICGDNMKYDACTGQCDVAGSDMSCANVVPLCQYAGQVKRVADNHRMYYYCAEDTNHMLRPVINKCPEGFFNELTGQCSISSVSGCKDPNNP